MALFFTKRRPVNIDLFTCRDTVYKYAPIEPANKFLPEWWKKLPRVNFEASPPQTTTTMKHCSGIIDLFNAGFVVPLWSDVVLQIGGEGVPHDSYQFADQESVIDFHPQMQRGSFAPENNHAHMKFVNPWTARCKEDIKWLLTGAQYSRLNLFDYTVVNGIAEFKFQNALNINMFLKRKEIQTVVSIPFRTPIMQVIPITERSMKLNLHLVDEKEFASLSRKSVSFEKNYYKMKKFLKSKGDWRG